MTLPLVGWETTQVVGLGGEAEVRERATPLMGGWVRMLLVERFVEVDSGGEAMGLLAAVVG